MKKLDRLILVLFSVFIFLQSVLLILIILGWINENTVITFFKMLLNGEKTSKVILGTSSVALLLSLKCIFIDSEEKKNKVTGVLMQNDNGKLLISKPTIENIVISVIKAFDSVQDVTVTTDLDRLNNLIINVNIAVSKDVIIKELTLNMQNKIKEAIKKTSDLEVKEVNIKIKDIISEKNDKNRE